MAIDLMASSASSNTVCSESIFDNPIPNHHFIGQTADSVAIGGAFKTAATAINKHHHSPSKTMKLDSVVQSNGNGHNHHQNNHHHEKGSFIEHIRRSITFNGGVTSLQPLTKLWLFRRHSSSSNKKQKIQKKVSQINSTTSPTSVTTSFTTKLDTNGNGGVPSNGVSINITDHQEINYRLNGRSNGHQNGHQLQHLTNSFTSSDVSVHYSSSSSSSSEHQQTLDCDSSSDEIASFDKDERSSVASSLAAGPLVSGHEHGSLDSGVVNADNAEDEEEEEAETCKLPLTLRGAHPPEDINLDKTGVIHFNTNTIDSSSSSTIVEYGQAEVDVNSSQSSESTLADLHQNDHHHFDNRYQSERSIVSCVSSSSFVVEEGEEEDDGDEDAKKEKEGGTSNSPNSSVVTQDSGHESMVSTSNYVATTPTPQPSTSAPLSPIVTVTNEQPKPEDDEQILESLRYVVRACTRTDLSKRASMGEVYGRMDAQLRSLRPRRQTTVKKTHKVTVTASSSQASSIQSQYKRENGSRIRSSIISISSLPEEAADCEEQL